MESNLEVRQEPAPEPEPAPTPVEPSAVVVIPRVMFNYVIIGVVCLVFGVVIGMIGYDQFSQANRVQTEALINKAVATAVAALPSSADTAAAVPDPNARQNVSIANRPSLGPANAPVVVVEFGDFHCSFCKRFHDETITPLLQHYGDQILYVYRDFPILGPDSLQAALAASCAYDQNAFWDFHDRLYADPSELTRDKFLQYAQDLGLDMDTFTQCYDTGAHQDAVVQDYNDGTALGVGGTPTFFINGKILIGAQPYEQFAAAIDAELESATDASTSTPQ